MQIPKILMDRSGVVIDTNVFIYLFENSPGMADIAEFVIEEAERGSYQGVITPITVAEITVKPFQEGRPDLVKKSVEALKNYAGIISVCIDCNDSLTAAALRGKYKLALPDMFQAAIALREKKPALITNDKALKQISEIDVFLLEDFNKS